MTDEKEITIPERRRGRRRRSKEREKRARASGDDKHLPVREKPSSSAYKAT